MTGLPWSDPKATPLEDIRKELRKWKDLMKPWVMNKTCACSFCKRQPVIFLFMGDPIEGKFFGEIDFPVIPNGFPHQVLLTLSSNMDDLLNEDQKKNLAAHLSELARLRRRNAV